MKYVEGSKRVFLDTGTRFPREVIWAIGAIKYSAAKSNVALGQLDRPMADAVMASAKEVMKGGLDARFEVDVFQTGSGTGLNMNANELIAELASQRSGLKVHPNDHVNMSQSSNDVGPTAVRVACAVAVTESLLPALSEATRSLRRLAGRTGTVYKSGRTHLRDALPVTMGQEFGAYGDAFSRDSKLLKSVLGFALEVPIGGTAVGTGLNCDPRFGPMVAKELAGLSGIKFSVAKNKFRATKLLTDVSSLSAAMRTVSEDLYRLSQDLRLMYSGPLTGFGEIDLPTQEEVAGSSIMPGKTNPVTVEAALLACSEVAGLDSANQSAALLGEFELAMGVPLLGYNVVMQARLLSEALRKVSAQVLDHLVPIRKRVKDYAEASQALVTIISPKIGYDKAAAIGKKLAKGGTIRMALKELGYTEKEVDRLLDLKRLVRPGIPAKDL